MRSIFPFGRWVAGAVVLAGGLVSGGEVMGAEERQPGVAALASGVELELVLEHPLVATPTGVDVDAEGRLWVVACHTHMPPEDYMGPDKDEILVFDGVDDAGLDGSSLARTVFYRSTYHTMDLELGDDGWVYLAERGRVLRVRDSDGDGVGDVEEVLASLETEADYPHNGLSGLAWHPDGDLCFTLGENYARQWTLTAGDGSSATGIGEGAVFRMSADGKGLRRLARGMWNPFGLVVREDGVMFAAENDPSERPPCRLLQVVEGGDYGYQRAYGPAASHPFVGWNGELRGTLPMIHPTGEAPCAVAVLGNGLLIPSWSDHRIDFYALSEKGAGFSAERSALLKGGRYFRPVSMVEDGRFSKSEKRVWYVTDWVDGRYPVHGFGRVWKLSVDLAKATDWVGEMTLRPRSEDALLAERLRSGKGEQVVDLDELFELAGDDDPFLAQAALRALSRLAGEWTPESVSGRDPVLVLLAVKLAAGDDRVATARWVPLFLASGNEDVRFEVLRWIADFRLEEYSSQVDAFLNADEISFALFEAAIAAKNTLAGKPEAGVVDMETVMERLLDDSTPPKMRAFVLRLAVAKPKTNPKSGGVPELRYPRGLTVELLTEMLDTGDELLTLEATRTLAGRPSSSRKILQKLASDEGRAAAVRAEAVIGLSLLASGNQQVATFLKNLADEAENDLVAEEARRAVRSSPTVGGGRPALTDTEGWLERLDAVAEPVDVERGRRLFFHPRLGLCANCHRHEGRGSVVGPDLSKVGQRGDRAWLLKSILMPSEDIAPEYLPRTVTLNDGSTFTGIRLRSSTREAMRDAAGRNVTFDRDQIAKMEELQVSFMPGGLPLMLTDRELRDLIAFLSAGVEDSE